MNPSDAATAESPADAARPGRPKFRKSAFHAPRLSPEQVSRQGAIAARAWSAFKDRERVLAFLNGHDETLGGRPLDVAIASDEGLEAVTLVIAGSVPARA